MIKSALKITAVISLMRQVIAQAGHCSELFTLPMIFCDIQIDVISSNILLQTCILLNIDEPSLSVPVHLSLKYIVITTCSDSGAKNTPVSNWFI